ncbi:MAG: hypothetical protein V8R75_10985 [Oscillospiraceae bacterium]
MNYIHSCGFFNGKARDIVACAKQLMRKARRQGSRYRETDRPSRRWKEDGKFDSGDITFSASRPML